jgi:SAM-dependent methyltransferase
MSLYDILNRPWIYALSQFLIAPGSEYFLVRHLKRLIRTLPPGRQPLLDVGCGPASRLWKCGLKPVGIDISEAYVEAFRQAGGEAHVGTATDLPFADQTFGGVWCFGILHHLDDIEARKAIEEMRRVCRDGGYVAIFDAVLPRSYWTRPLAYWTRKMDRGRHVRNMEAHQRLFSGDGWRFSRLTYALTGLEGSLSILENNGTTRDG